MKKGFVCGVFDMFHLGHLLMLEECKKHCDFLVVAVNKAENIDPSINPEKLPQIYSFNERKSILEGCKYVDKVKGYNSEEELYQLMEEEHLDIRFLGDDYRGKKITGVDLNIPIHYCDRSHGLSTSGYKNELFELMNKHFQNN